MKVKSTRVKSGKMIIQHIDKNLAQLFNNAKRIKPKYSLTTEQMDDLIENEISRKVQNSKNPRESIIKRFLLTTFVARMSEKSLAKDWLSEEDEKAWENL